MSGPLPTNSSLKQAVEGGWIESLLFLAAFVMTALDAYNFFEVPFEWYSLFVVFLILPFLYIKRARILVPGVKPYIFLFIWSLIVTVTNIAVAHVEFGDQNCFFVIRRFIRLAGFIAALICCHWVLSIWGIQRFTRVVVFVGCGYSLLGIYFYFAQLNGLPELPRTRMGTFGGAQSVVFTYPFHRLMGTFREPGFFVGWVLLPLFLAFRSLKESPKDISPGIILGATMLTGSLAAAIVIGIAFCVVFTGWLASGWPKGRVIPVLRNILLAIIIFFICLHGYEDTHGYYIKDTSSYSVMQMVSMVIQDRVFPLVTHGAEASNRAYVYGYLSQTPFTLFGKGLGLANLEFAEYLDTILVPSFLNMYSFFLVSSGWVGLAILVVALLLPLYMLGFDRMVRNSWLVALYLSHALMFFFTVEELTFSFSICVALILVVARSSNKNGLLN